MKLRDILLTTAACLLPAAAGAQTTALGTAGTVDSQALVQAVGAVASHSAGSAYDLWRSVGMNIHLEYDAAAGMGDNPYGDTAKVEDAIRYLSLSSLRAYATANAFARMPAVHDATGAMFDFSFTTGWGQTYDSQKAMALSVLGSSNSWIEAIGNANEVDNWQVTFNGQTGYAADAAQQRQMAADFSSYGIPIYATSMANPADFANLGNLTGTATYSDAHTYPPNGAQPSTWLPGWLSSSQTVSLFFVQTEAGYSTLAAGAHAFDGSVSERAQARLLLNLLVDSYQLGVAHTYVYELVDSSYGPGQAACDPGQTDRELHFGLYRCDWSAKPAAEALHSFMAVLADKPPTGPLGGALNFSVSGLPNGKSLLVQKTDGGFVLIVWCEPTIWDPNGLSDIEAPTQTATVTFGETARSVVVYDPLVGDTPIRTASNAASVDVPVSDHPVLIVLNASGIGGSQLLAAAMNLVNVQPLPAPTVASGTGQGSPAATSAPGAPGADQTAGSLSSSPPSSPSPTQAWQDGRHHHHHHHHGDWRDQQQTARGDQGSGAQSQPSPGGGKPTPVPTPADSTASGGGSSSSGTYAAPPTSAPASAPVQSPPVQSPPVQSLAPVAVATGNGPSVTVSSDAALQDAVHNAAPGTTIHVAPGTYSGGIDITANGITVVSDTPGAATIIGGGATANGDMVTLSGNNVTFSGFNVSGAQSSNYSLVTMLGSNDTVANSRIHDLQTGGLLSWGMALGTDGSIKGGSGGQLLNNTVYNVGPPGSTSNTVQGIYVASHNVTVSGNLIHDIASTCITSWHDASAMTVTYNTCDSAYQGITVGASDGFLNSGSVVNDNVVTNTATPIDQEGSTTPAAMTGNVVGQPLSGNYALTSGSTTAGYTAAPAAQ